MALWIEVHFDLNSQDVIYSSFIQKPVELQGILTASQLISTRDFSKNQQAGKIGNIQTSSKKVCKEL